ncbi:MAG: methionine--tRNA ligase [Nitrospirae bacterium]|nr:MAG: methionine--tRNA ligase [Nitrospirota bacterium]
MTNQQTPSFYITTPIYYVNDVPHIGHAYTTIAADALARFHRLLGYDVFFLTGLDEHGQKVQQAAMHAGVDPQTHCDRLAPRFMELWKVLDISHDAFIRTTDPHHQAIVQRYLQALYDKGLIYRAAYTGWYCTFDERFWTEKDVPDGLCPDCRRPVEQLSETNYFFRMSRFQDRLRCYIHEHPPFIRPEVRRNEVLGFLQKPLEDLSISRPKTRLSWGIPLPFDSDYVTYVWFDALINYISALEYLTPQPAFDRYWPASIHLVGKDILTTHAVYWSTMLMALELPLPKTIFAHGWWTVDGEKMSKSRGNVVDPYAVVQEYGVDAFRYFLLREVPFGQDGDFSITALIERYNAYLANGIGNLFSRTLTLVERYCQRQIPPPGPSVHRTFEEEIKTSAEQLLPAVRRCLIDQDGIVNPEFQPALKTIWQFITLVDRYLDHTAPWSLAKRPEGAEQLHTVLYTTSEALRFLSLILAPFIPSTARTMREQLGLDAAEPQDAVRQFQWGQLRPGTQIEKKGPLFPRFDSARQASEPRMSSTTRLQPPPPLPSATTTHQSTAQAQSSATETLTAQLPQITIHQFQQVQLKVGKIVAAERIPKSSKLLKLQVDLGTETRQIVAGIGAQYAPDTLVGQLVVVVANLQPAKLMGVESQGMVLAAGDKEVHALVTLTAPVPPGTPIR